MSLVVDGVDPDALFSISWTGDRSIDAAATNAAADLLGKGVSASVLLAEEEVDGEDEDRARRVAGEDDGPARRTEGGWREG